MIRFHLSFWLKKWVHLLNRSKLEVYFPCSILIHFNTAKKKKKTNKIEQFSFSVFAVSMNVIKFSLQLELQMGR